MEDALPMHIHTTFMGPHSPPLSENRRVRGGPAESRPMHSQRLT